MINFLYDPGPRGEGDARAIALCSEFSLCNGSHQAPRHMGTWSMLNMNICS
jgi:hypothetical protein